MARKLTAVELAELRGLAVDLTQMCLDLAGIVDPTPISDGASALISLGRGRWLDAALSGVSMVPYIGDLAKAGKFPRYLATLERAIVAAQTSAESARLLRPVIERLASLLDLFPAQATGEIARLRSATQRFLRENRVVRIARRDLPDISRHFRVRPRWRQGRLEYEEIAGRLGVPGKVKVHRNVNAQRAMSAGTGDHAGHRIGAQFGAPGDATNLSLQNANINSYAPRELHAAFQGPGGSYHRLESEWSAKLKEGYGIEALVRDRYRPGEARPFSRLVEWTEITPNGVTRSHSIEFLNTTSPQSRAATGW